MPLMAEGEPTGKELNETDLGIRQPLRGGGDFLMVCHEADFSCALTDEKGKPMHRALEMTGENR